MKTIFLPRQAQDKHRENSKTARFLAGKKTARCCLSSRAPLPDEMKNERKFAKTEERERERERAQTDSQQKVAFLSLFVSPRTW
jgi:hypothetical protein